MNQIYHSRSCSLINLALLSTYTTYWLAQCRTVSLATRQKRVISTGHTFIFKRKIRWSVMGLPSWMTQIFAVVQKILSSPYIRAQDLTVNLRFDQSWIAPVTYCSQQSCFATVGFAPCHSLPRILATPRVTPVCASASPHVCHLPSFLRCTTTHGCKWAGSGGAAVYSSRSTISYTKQYSTQ